MKYFYFNIKRECYIQITKLHKLYSVNAEFVECIKKIKEITKL